MPNTFIQPIPPPKVLERSSFTTSAEFRDSAHADDAPTTAHYRIDDLTTGQNILDWTALTPAASISITVKSSENRMLSSAHVTERRQITVAADKGTDGETRDTAIWEVENIGGFNE